MLTDKTQAAIAALRAVAYCVPHSSPDASPSVPVRMLRDLEDCGLIRLLPGGNPSSPGSYELCRSFSSLSLYDLLLAIGEGVFPVSPDASEEHTHRRFGYVSGASRLGVINHMLRTLLDGVSLSSL